MPAAAQPRTGTGVPPLTAPWAIAALTVAFAPVVLYGDGLAGAGDVVTVLDTGGETPDLGNRNFQIATHGVRGGAQGCLAIATAPGAFPLPNGTLPVATEAITGIAAVAVDGAPGAAGAGSFALPLPIPWDPRSSGSRSSARPRSSIRPRPAASPSRTA